MKNRAEIFLHDNTKFAKLPQEVYYGLGQIRNYSRKTTGMFFREIDFICKYGL